MAVAHHSVTITTGHTILGPNELSSSPTLAHRVGTAPNLAPVYTSTNPELSVSPTRITKRWATPTSLAAGINQTG